MYIVDYRDIPVKRGDCEGRIPDFLNPFTDPPGLVPGVKKAGTWIDTTPRFNVCLHRHKVGGRPEVIKLEVSRLYAVPRQSDLIFFIYYKVY